jgi:SET and MYND domain-containing protein
MQVIALRDIPPNEEASLNPLLEALSLTSDYYQILTSYIDITLPRPLRQVALKETYDFTCQCELCDDDNKIDPRESVWCPKSCGGMCPAPSDGEDTRNFT